MELGEVSIYLVDPLSKTPTYLTIDRLGAHGNNADKSAEDNLSWSGNGCKRSFAAKRKLIICANFKKYCYMIRKKGDLMQGTNGW